MNLVGYPQLTFSCDTLLSGNHNLYHCVRAESCLLGSSVFTLETPMTGCGHATVWSAQRASDETRQPSL